MLLPHTRRTRRKTTGTSTNSDLCWRASGSNHPNPYHTEEKGHNHGKYLAVHTCYSSCRKLFPPNGAGHAQIPASELQVARPISDFYKSASITARAGLSVER